MPRFAWLLGISWLLVSCTSPADGGKPPPPTIARFAAASSPVTAGTGTTLTAVFADGAAVIDHGIGPVQSDTAVDTGALAASTSYTLTVTNVAGVTATRQVTVEVAPLPVVTGFTPARPVVTQGEATLLTPVFAGGTAVIDPGVGPVSSGAPVSTGSLAASTTYTLKVTNAAGAVATARATVEVVAAPVITSFAPAAPTVPAGNSTALDAVFTDGVGVVDQGVGVVSPGVAVDTGPLSATTDFTLTVMNAAGTAVARQATVRVVSGPPLTFTTEGDAFSPVIVVTGSPAILWTFPDGTTSPSATPTKWFGSVATRRTTLTVTPWSAVTRINVGYDGRDDGPTDIEHVDDQHVSAVEGLEVVAPSLRQWCSSYNDLTSLDFTDFVVLEDIEAYQSPQLATVKLQNTPSLKRIVVEATHLGELDVSTSLQLADLRAGASTYLSLFFAPVVYPALVHICVRDNPQLTDTRVFADTTRWPLLAQLWTWNANQEGTLRVPSTRPTGAVSVIVDDNRYTSLDFRGAFQGTVDEAVLSAVRNRVTAIDVTGCRQLTQVDLRSNPLSPEAEDALLATLDAFGRAREAGMDWPFLVDLRGNAVPTAAGRASAASLAAKGWTVLTDAWTEAPAP